MAEDVDAERARHERAASANLYLRTSKCSSALGPGDYDALGLVSIGLEFGMEMLESENC